MASNQWVVFGLLQHMEEEKIKPCPLPISRYMNNNLYGAVLYSKHLKCIYYKGSKCLKKQYSTNT